MRVIELSGSPIEIGRQHGQLGKKEINQSLETYEKLFFDYKKIRWKTVKEQAKRYISAIEKFDSSLLEEIQGVAEGSSREFEDILSLNARSEIALAGNDESDFIDGCTSIFTTSPLTEDTIIGQNWDWKQKQKESLLLLNIKRKTKPNILMVTEGGLIGKIGCNNHGIGVGLNALHSKKKKYGVPIHLGLRSILDSLSLHDAMAKIQKGQMASAANFIIGYSEGKNGGLAFHVEVSPFGIAITNNELSYGVHTNHILSSKIRKKVGEGNEFKYSDSEIRKRRGEQLIQQAIKVNKEIDEDTFKNWLCDEFNKPNSIKHFINENVPEHRQMITVFSIIMNLTEGKIFISDGMPSYEMYKEYTI